MRNEETHRMEPGRRIARAAGLSTFLLLLAIAAGAQEWPQWRGPQGLGIADASGLPVEWGPESGNVRWRTTLPGDGISSPIVSDGRVFVTTAYEGQGSAVRDLVLRGLLAATAVLFVWLALARRRRAQLACDGLDPQARKRLRRTVWLVLGVSFLFALAALLVAVRPELFLEAGNPGRSWRAGSTLALLGLAASVGWLRPASPGRLWGSLALLAVTAYLAFNIPTGPLGKVSADRAVTAVLPGLLGALWGLASFWRMRCRAAAPASGFRDPRMVLPLAAMALLIFVPPNFLSGLQRVVVCLDLESGEVLWERAVLQAPPEQKWPRSSYATPTTVADGDRVYAYFGAGIAALDLEGRVLWKRRFPNYVGHTRYGAGASPVLADDSVILVQESEMYQEPTPSWMAAFDRQTGETRWRIEPEDMRDSYSTPLLMPAPGGEQLVTASWKKLLAFDPASGERLWSLEYPMWQLVASPARAGDLLAVSGGAHGDKSLYLVRAPGEGGEPELLWQSSRTVAEVPSPLIYDEMLFTVTSGGVLTNYDVETGEVLFRKRLDGEYYASLVAGDGKVYATNTAGATTVLAAAPDYEELAVNESADGVYASPALADGGILIRSARELFFIDGAGGVSDGVAEARVAE